MPKLNLKRTAEEEAAHRERKRQRKFERHRRKEFQRVHDEYANGPSYSADSDLEEARFRERMAMAFEDDERLDSLENQLNGFAHMDTHIPLRWGGSAPRNNYEGDEYLKVDPSTLNDEEYAEWVRVGMYRKSHAGEYEEAQRRKAEKAASKARAIAAKEETKKLEKALDAERQQLKHERQAHRRELARAEYESRWNAISTSEDLYHFHEIPWPIVFAYSRSSSASLAVEDLTADSITSFLFTSISVSSDEEKKERKDRLRETYLRFHPDKFESRVMKRVVGTEQEKVRLGVGQVVRILNDLMQHT